MGSAVPPPLSLGSPCWAGGTQNLSVFVQGVNSKDGGRTRASCELLVLHGGLGTGEHGDGAVGTPCCLRGRASCPQPHLSASCWGSLSMGGLNSAPTASSCLAEPCPWQGFRLDSSGLKTPRLFPSGGI